MVTGDLHLQDPHRHCSTQKLPIRARPAIVLRIYVTGEVAIKPSLAPNGRGAIVVSSSGADETLECLNAFKSLQNFDELYILLCVEEYKLVAGKIIEKTTQSRVLQGLSKNKTAAIKIVDLHNLDGFLGWSWKDIQRKLLKIKTVKFILYVKQKGQLIKAINDLRLDHLYLFGDTECDTVEDRCEVLKVGNFVR